MMPPAPAPRASLPSLVERRAAWARWLLLGAGLLPACGGDTEDGGTGSGGTGGSGGSTAPECASPTPVVAGAAGWERCANGRLHRPEAVTCPSTLPRAVECVPAMDGGAVGCTLDSDCADQPHGWCSQGEFGDPYCGCRYGCTTDAECGAGNVCLCGDPVGRCVPADCTTDADCGRGQLCADHDSSQGCSSTRMTCTTPADECFADTDCDGGLCSVDTTTGARACLPWGCAIGRPFVVEGAARLAAAVPGAGWLGDGGPFLAVDDAALRAELIAHWTGAALAEHASVAAFARFTLQLLALGAPAALVAGSQQAGLDEIRHAQRCFALVAALADAAGADARAGGDDRAGTGAVQPGPIELAGALSAIDALEVARLCFIEGCVGETVAALEATEAAAAARDPGVRAVLLGIAADEAEHARLAWRTVAWLAQRDARVAPALQAELRAARAPRAPALPHRPELLAEGVVDQALRAELRAAVLRDAVGPGLDAITRAGRGGSAAAARAVA